MSSNIRQAREALGLKLREIRLDASLSGKDLAARLDWQASKVSKIELGRQTPTDQDIRFWLQACEAPGREHDLITELRTLNLKYAEWRRQLGTGVRARQQEIHGAERQASSIRAFQTSIIPGLLQIPAYIEARFTETVEVWGISNDIQQGMQARLQRQEALYRVDCHIVVTEAAIRYGLAPREVMIEQLDRLLMATTLPKVRLGVIPLDAQYPVVPYHGFHLLDDRVLVETFSAELTLMQPTEIALYEKVFDLLAGAARYGLEARKIISFAMKRLAEGSS